MLFISMKQFSVFLSLVCLCSGAMYIFQLASVFLFSYLNSAFYHSACADCTSRPVSLFILKEMGTLSVFRLCNIKSICCSVNLISSIRLKQNQPSLSSKYNWFNMTVQQKFDSCSPFFNRFLTVVWQNIRLPVYCGYTVEVRKHFFPRIVTSHLDFASPSHPKRENWGNELEKRRQEGLLEYWLWILLWLQKLSIHPAYNSQLPQQIEMGKFDQTNSFNSDIKEHTQLRKLILNRFHNTQHVERILISCKIS